MTGWVQIDPLADERWDRYVESHPRASVHHLSPWARILASCYGFKPRYLALEADGGLVGVLPLVSSGRRLSGSRASSLPTAKAAGPLADSPEQERTLLGAALEISEREGLSSVLVRSQSPGLEGDGVDVGTATTQVLELGSSPEELLASYKKGASNLYRSIRKAQKAELVVEESNSERELREWYRLYLLTVRRHHNLPRRLKQMREASRWLGDHWRLVTVKKDGAVIAGGVFHDIAGTVELMYNASDRKALSLRPNHALYWHVINDSIERGRRSLDFGVSNHESLSQFKAQWGAATIDYYFYVHGRGSTSGDGESAPASDAAPPPLKTRLTGRAKHLASDLLAVSPPAVSRAAGAIAYRFV